MKLLDNVINIWTKRVRPVIIPVTRKHVVVVSAFVKDGVVSVSYNGQVKIAKFDDKTLRDMVYGIDFNSNSLQVFKAAATLLKEIISK